MSRVMRRRNGLIGLSLSVMGLFLLLRKGLGNHNLNTGQTLPVNHITAPISSPKLPRERFSPLTLTRQPG